VPPADPRGEEFRLIAAYLGGLDRSPAVTLGNGDDGAVLRLPAGEELVVSTDAAAEGVHFPPGSAPEKAVFRALGAAASDLAAMGARPLALTLNLSLPTADKSVLRALRTGLEDAVDRFDLPLVGGDLIRGPLSFGVQVLGSVPPGEALTRSGARAGDRLCVSGPLGDPAAGLALIEGRLAAETGDAQYLTQRFWRPEPALALGQILRRRASAAIDVSDGLLADAGHLAAASGVRLRIDSEVLPLSPALRRSCGEDRARRFALTGGEDYVLCFTLPRGEALPDGCHVIGNVEAGDGVHCDLETETDGFQHF